MATVPQTEKQKLAIQLECYETVLSRARADLRQARTQLLAAQNAFDKANTDYQRIVYCLLTYDVRHSEVQP